MKFNERSKVKISISHSINKGSSVPVKTSMNFEGFLIEIEEFVEFKFSSSSSTSKLSGS